MLFKPYHLIYAGKTKDAFSVKNHPELLVIRFKNNVLGKNGIPDSGGNEVIGSLPGKGRACSRITVLFSELFRKNGIRTNIVRAKPNGEIVVKNTALIPIEFICRNMACGRYLERFPKTKKFSPLGGMIEFTLKSDEAGDPFLTEKQALDFISQTELKRILTTIRKINSTASAFCAAAGMRLVDFKVEFGRRGKNILLIDDFSTDTARFL